MLEIKTGKQTSKMDMCEIHKLAALERCQHVTTFDIWVTSQRQEIKDYHTGE